MLFDAISMHFSAYFSAYFSFGLDFEASQATLLLENDFSSLILDHFKLETRIILLTDASHEVPVVDLTRDRWRGSQSEPFKSPIPLVTPETSKEKKKTSLILFVFI